MIDIKNRIKNFWGGIIGNVLDHYDMALYSFLAMYIAPNVFSNDDKLTALIKIYGIFSVNIICRPLGSLFFGRVAMFIGARFTLIMCLLGVAFTTTMIAMTPTYDVAGWGAAAYLVVARATQSFFASGEQSVAAFFIMQDAPEKKLTMISSFYNSSTMIGILLAGIAAMLVSYSSDPEFFWRIPFGLGSVTAIIGIWLRLSLNTTKPIKSIRKISFNYTEICALLVKNADKILRVAALSSFSYITYSIPFVFMNNYMTIVSDIDSQLSLNNLLMILDAVLIILFGNITQHMDRTKLMATMSLTLAFLSVILFANIENATYLYVLFTKMCIIVIGLAFLSPLTAWMYEQFSGDDKYILTGIGYNLGSEIFGRSAPFVCLALYKYFESSIAVGLYISFISLIAAFGLLYKPKRHKSIVEDDIVGVEATAKM